MLTIAIATPNSPVFTHIGGIKQANSLGGVQRRTSDDDRRLSTIAREEIEGIEHSVIRDFSGVGATQGVIVKLDTDHTEDGELFLFACGYAWLMNEQGTTIHRY